MAFGNVTASVELIMELPKDEGSPTSAEFEAAVIDAIKRGLWYHITNTNVVYVRPENER